MVVLVLPPRMPSIHPFYDVHYSYYPKPLLDQCHLAAKVCVSEEGLRDETALVCLPKVKFQMLIMKDMALI